MRLRIWAQFKKQINKYQLIVVIVKACSCNSGGNVFVFHRSTFQVMYLEISRSWKVTWKLNLPTQNFMSWYLCFYWAVTLKIKILNSTIQFLKYLNWTVKILTHLLPGDYFCFIIIIFSWRKQASIHSYFNINQCIIYLKFKGPVLENVDVCCWISRMELRVCVY